MEVDSPPPLPTRHSPQSSATTNYSTPTYEAILVVESLLEKSNLLHKASDAWERVKTAALKDSAQQPTRASQDASKAQVQPNDIAEIKAQLAGLTDIVKGLTEAPKGPQGPKGLLGYRSFAEAVRQGLGTKRPPPGVGTRILPVPARLGRQAVIKAPSLMQGRTAQQVVQDANAAIGANAVAAAQRLLSGETILTFHKKEGRAKWESDERLLRTFGPGATLCTKTFTVLAYRVPTTLSINN